MTNKIWVFEDVLYWNDIASTGSHQYYGESKRSYEIWERANNLVEKNETQFDLSDGITNLKRSLNHRLQLIEKIYNFKKINFDNMPKGYLELLESYGIVRPYLMKTLMQIRNDIEHNDAIPPNQLRCKELADVVWYFLKSTDSIVLTVIDYIEFGFYNKNGEDTPYYFSIEIDYCNHASIKINGQFPREVISFEERNDFICIKTNNFQLKNKIPNLEEYKNNIDADILINGFVDINELEYQKYISYILKYVI